MNTQTTSLTRFRLAPTTEENGVCIVPFANSETEAFGIRAIMQRFCFHHELRLFGTTRPSVMAMLSGEDPPFGRVLVLCCHGDGYRNIRLWEDESLRPENLQGNIHLEGKIVIATGCSVGTPEMAKAFLDGGAQAFSAPEDDPEGGTDVLYTALFLHALLKDGNTIQEAHDRARAWDKETAMHRLWLREE